MKKVLMIAITLAFLIVTPVRADEIKNVWATAYNLTGKTATGTITQEGRTVAGKREWLGSTMYVWEDDGDGKIKAENFIGMFTVEDTGGQTIQNGSVIDIYMADLKACRQFGSKRVIIQIVESEG